MVLTSISRKIADALGNELGYDEEKREIISYGIENLLLTVIGFVTIIMVAYFFAALIPAAFAAISGGLLRKLSGGAHFNTPLKCLAFGAVVYSFIGVIAKYAENYSMVNRMNLVIILIAAVIIIAWRAPVDCEAKPIHSDVLKMRLKILSIILVLFISLVVIFNNSILVSISLVLGVVYQTLTLLPLFNKRRCELT